VQGLDIPRRWWELFHCDPLNTVVARAIARNPDLAAAQAALRIANANTQAARGVYYPQAGASIGSSSQKPNVAQTQPIGTGTSPYTIATAQLSVSFVLDVFGLNKRPVRQCRHKPKRSISKSRQLISP
jgi:outer membrane protein TolC